jgi:hypothetical protein
VRRVLIEPEPWTPCRRVDFLIDSSISSILAAGHRTRRKGYKNIG